ncbi:MAG: polymerase III, subunit gamma and tau protein [Candidatus Gottesmanbacteria bacterium GW2011_GWA2_41_12]|uniref:DNA polymerase III subunit gamma/tau n=2 Tax=Candidatus Gottesmaniibacteriota TaxID=1752720 RepID=A0A0G0XKW0_9BACT|nr:MAG: polymerase III, subunit gamma and tau protein [Candidatus Gottesmanbacteria bacterium GW2011_GWC2_39_8]KKR88317.1 MAG: polymerase III, subunit gamma and tau protein [Candidatus Gottesmanbacteria bacterium GW2011_GWA2_41_12]
MVYYRKYRPQKISELDSPIISARLGKIISSGHIPHAFLFSGPKGTGKTSTARILAKVLNCEKLRTENSEPNTNFEPCNKCDNCVSITAGTNLDVMEIDAASNRGIDEIRDLREKIRLAPSGGKFKVYIIDEVHMLTTEAFNALLKTLEEPPPHAVFVLATTEPDKLLPTIISRCIRIDFKKASAEEIIHSMERIIKEEKIDINRDILNLIAASSDGSFRDGAKMLEQVVLEEADTLEKAEKVIGGGENSYRNLLMLMISGKTKEALIYLQEMEKKGSNLKYTIESILNLLHTLLLSKSGIESAEVNKSFEILTLNEVKELLRYFDKAYGEMRNSFIPSLPLELLIIEWGEKKKS